MCAHQFDGNGSTKSISILLAGKSILKDFLPLILHLKSSSEKNKRRNLEQKDDYNVDSENSEKSFITKTQVPVLKEITEKAKPFIQNIFSLEYHVQTKKSGVTNQSMKVGHVYGRGYY